MSCMTPGLAFDRATAEPVRPPQADPTASLSRPRLLVRAARAGQGSWRRERDLPRLLGSAVLPGSATVLRLLAAEEAFLDAARQQRAGTYSPERHVLVLIALLAEMTRSAAAATPVPPQTGVVVVPFSGRGTARPARP